MMDLEFTFEETGWETWLDTKKPGQTVTAGELLTVLEPEEEQAVEDVFLELEEAGMVLDLSDLPRNFGTGEAALRLRREQELVRTGLCPDTLEENDPLRIFLEEVAATPAWGDEDLLALAHAQGDPDAGEKLTALGLARVIALAGEYTGYGVLLLDLIQEGSMGLWQAIGQYQQGDYGLQRDARIRFAMAKAVILQARAGGVGLKLRSAMEDYRAVDERLLSELGRNATVEEIAEQLHLSVEETEAVRKSLDNARRMQQAHQEQEEPEPTEEDEQAVENTALFQMRQRINELLSSLNEQDQKLLTLRFGLEGALPMSPGDVGRQLGLTPEEVVARETAALAKLRNNG